MFTLYDVKMIQIWTFPAASSIERVLSLAELISYLRYSIYLRLFNWRVPALISALLACFFASQVHYLKPKKIVEKRKLFVVSIAIVNGFTDLMKQFNYRSDEIENFVI